METKYERVTPALAKKWLRTNLGNRHMRPSRVECLRAAFERGEYIQSAHGIVFDIEGTLVDGQHRLTAISLLPPDWEGQITVTRGAPKDMRLVIDTGLTKRSTGDVLCVEQGLGQVGNFLCKVYMGNTTRVTVQRVAPIVEWVTPEYRELVDFCPTHKRIWSAACIRAAALYLMKAGADKDYVLLAYRAQVQVDFDSMSTISRLLYRAIVEEKVHMDAHQVFARCVKVFDAKNAEMRILKLIEGEQGRIVAQARQFIDREVFDGERVRRMASATPDPRRRADGTYQALAA